MMPRAAGSVGAAGLVGAADGARSARRSPGLGRAGPGQTRASVHEVRVAFLSFDDT